MGRYVHFSKDFIIYNNKIWSMKLKLNPLKSKMISTRSIKSILNQCVLIEKNKGMMKIDRNLSVVWRRWWRPTPVLLPGKSHGWRNLVGCSPWGHTKSDTTERLHFHFHALEKEMATHSSVLAWRIPGMGEPGELPSMGSHRVGHDWSDLAAAAAYTNVFKHMWFT